MRKVVGVLSVGLVLILPVSAAMPAQQSVVPGHSVSRVTLGMARTDVWKHLGKPAGSDTFRYAGQRYVEDYWQGSRGVLNAVVSYKGKVIQTQHDLGPVYETFSSIREHHPHLRISLYDHGGDVGSDLILDDIQQGMAWKIYIWHEEFTYSRNGAARTYDNSVANWVITHQRGQPALPNPSSKPITNILLLHNLRAWFAAKPTQTHKGN